MLNIYTCQGWPAIAAAQSPEIHPPVGGEERGEFIAKDLDRERAAVLDVVGEVDRRHPPATELALDPVSIGQGGRESGEGTGQRRLAVRDLEHRRMGGSRVGG
jgi:hypothetical protein